MRNQPRFLNGAIRAIFGMSVLLPRSAQAGSPNPPPNPWIWRSRESEVSAYTVYIIHQPVLIFLGLVLSGIRLPHLLKFALIAPVAVALSFLPAHYIRKLPLAKSIL